MRTPHTILPDSLAETLNAKYHVEGVEESQEISGGVRRLEIYHMKGSLHTSGMLMTYLPQEKMLTEGDPWTPGMVNPKPNDRAYQRCCAAQNLCDNIKRLYLDVEKFVPINGRVDTQEHVLEYLGKPPEKAAKEQKTGN